MNLWIKNTDGKSDAVLTLAVIAFFVVILKVLLAGVVIDSVKMSFGSIDVSMASMLLGSTLGAYVTRRYTTAKFTSPSEEK